MKKQMNGFSQWVKAEISKDYAGLQEGFKKDGMVITRKGVLLTISICWAAMIAGAMLGAAVFVNVSGVASASLALVALVLMFGAIGLHFLHVLTGTKGYVLALSLVCAFGGLAVGLMATPHIAYFILPTAYLLLKILAWSSSLTPAKS